MDKELLQQIWPTFSAEARESVEALSAGLLALERAASQRDPNTLRNVLRVAHNLKGSAASLGFNDIVQIAHALESALSGLAADANVPAARVEAGLRALEAVERAVERGDAGEELVIADLDALVAALGAEPAQPQPAVETAATPGAEPRALEAELWPLFRADAIACLEALRAELGAEATTLEAAPAAAQSLLGLAESLGAQALAGRVRALQAELRTWSPNRRAGTQTLLAEVACEVSALEQQLAPAPTATDPLAELESLLPQLAAPPSAARDAVLARFRSAALSLTGDAAPALQALLPDLERGGPDGIRASVRIAGMLVDLRAAPQAPSPAPEAPQPEAAQTQKLDRSIRVSGQLVESVMAQVESMILSRSREERRSRRLREIAGTAFALGRTTERTGIELRSAGPDASQARLREIALGLKELQRELNRLASDGLRETEQLRVEATVVRDSLRDLRMVPASKLLEPVRRTVRDVAGRLQKQVNLSLQGGEVRLDRRIADELRDPLGHLVRNAIDHGLESPESRRALGKPELGALEVSVEQRGSRIAVITRDDGAGLNLERIRAKAVQNGLLSKDAAARLSDDEAAQLIFRPGFSTAREVTEVSGRGVGLDVVQATAIRLQGSVVVSHQPGRGTTFTMDLPLTLAAASGLVIESGRTRAAIAADAVARVVRLGASELATVAGQPVATVEAQQLPFARLGELIGAGSTRSPLERGEPQLCLVLAVGAQRVAVAVDAVLAHQELVLQPLGERGGRLPHLSGAAVLDDGEVVPVLNASELVRRARDVGPRAAEAAKRRILIVDDSPTTRSTMRALLELAGFSVVAATQGEEALRLLAENRCQLVVSDVEMPVLDGLGLTRRIRQDPSLASTPVILVTSLDRPEDRNAGLEAGADRYLVKREAQRGKLLEYVRQLLPGHA